MKVHGQNIEYSFGAADAPDRNWRDFPDADSVPSDDDSAPDAARLFAAEKLAGVAPGTFGDGAADNEETTVEDA